MSRRGHSADHVQFDEYARGGLIEGPDDDAFLARIDSGHGAFLARLAEPGGPYLTAAQLRQLGIGQEFLQQLNATPPGDTPDEQPPA